MSRALPLVLAGVITAGVAGAAVLPVTLHSTPAAGVSALSAAPGVQVLPVDWTVAGRSAGQAVAKQLAAQRAASKAAAAAAAQAAQAAADAAARQARAAQAASEASRSRAVVVSSGDPRSIARSMLDARGWGGQFGCLDSLWSRESGWSVYAANASGAYGIPQALPGSKMASAGSDWRTNAATQIRWGLGYIGASYGSPCGAWAHSQSYGWY